MMISTLTQDETVQMIEGPAGQLELVLALSVGEGGDAIAVVCHPHPLYGGTMHNKIVTTLTKMFQHKGAHTVRFNFRGVGRSEGHYANGEGELDDLMAVIEWLQQLHPNKELWLAGFSFGSYVAARAAVQLNTAKLVMVAPPVQHFPLRLLPPVLCPWVVVQGEQDDVVPPKAVFDWIETRDPKPVVIRFPEAGHYFHGQLAELRTRIEEVLF